LRELHAVYKLKSQAGVYMYKARMRCARTDERSASVYLVPNHMDVLVAKTAAKDPYVVMNRL
jgi:hypothetical protein